MKLRAVVIDDDYALRTLVVCKILKDRGYEVSAFSEPYMCPVNLDKNCPCPDNHFFTNIIITDINMPYMNGLEFIENQKKKFM